MTAQSARQMQGPSAAAATPPPEDGGATMAPSSTRPIDPRADNAQREEAEMRRRQHGRRRAIAPFNSIFC